MRTAAWARAVLRRLFNMVFALGYLAYVHTPLGLMIHTRVRGHLPPKVGLLFLTRAVGSCAQLSTQGNKRNCLLLYSLTRRGVRVLSRVSGAGGKTMSRNTRSRRENMHYQHVMCGPSRCSQITTPTCS